jgi:hypothetical protein
MNMAQQKLSVLHKLIAPRSYFGLLISLFLLTLLSAGTSDGPFTRVAISVLALALVGSIGLALSRAKHTAYGMIFGGVVISVMLIASNLFSVEQLHAKFFKMSSYVLAILYIFSAAVIILRDVFSGRVNANRICGAICFYSMIGMCFGMFFFALDMHDTTSFKIEHFYNDTPKAGLPISVHDRYTLFNYYSFCTLTTLGYGDITPISQPARTFSWMEAMFGQLYLSILVARLVGLHLVEASTSDIK